MKKKKNAIGLSHRPCGREGGLGPGTCPPLSFTSSASGDLVKVLATGIISSERYFSSEKFFKSHNVLSGSDIACIYNPHSSRERCEPGLQ